MIFTIKKFLLSCFGVITLLSPLTSSADPICPNNFPNFITDVCWDCVFPFTLWSGALSLDPTGTQETFKSGDGAPICYCGPSDGLKVGVPVGFWEMAYIVDVHTAPGCLTTLGGIKLPLPFAQNEYGKIDSLGNKADARRRSSFRHSTYYVSPMMYLMGAVLDDSCSDRSPFDVGWTSELDPTWNDDQLALIKMPISYTFGSIPAVMAGGIDAAAANIGFPINNIFWQAGSWGPMYPLTGNVMDYKSADQNARLVTTRMLAEAHAMKELAGLFGNGGGRSYACEPGELFCDFNTSHRAMCAGSPSSFPSVSVMPKRQYKLQRMFPVGQTSLIGGTCCQPIGRSTIAYEAGVQVPLEGYKDFGYSVFRKRDCCSGISAGSLF